VHGTIETALRVEWRALAELGPLVGAWRALAARALEPNVFYEPAIALAAAPVFGRDAGAGLVWAGSANARLVGFFPGRIERCRYGLGPAVLVGWTHAFAPLGTPLVDRDVGAAVVGAWFDHLAQDRDLPGLLLLPYCPEHGAVTQALDHALAARGGRLASFSRHERALLAPDAAGRIGYLDRAMGAKKRKELRRQRNRLADDGTVTHRTARDPAAVAEALAEFLALEAAGWKGRAGTAAQDDHDVRHFMETTLARLAADGQVTIERLCIDGRAIAAAIVLRSGTSAWCWKIAYDEHFARASPGVQLVADVTQALLDDPMLTRADSCATADHPMIDHIWRERLPLADRLIAVGPDALRMFAPACMLERVRRGIIAKVKAARHALRRG
jgi:CelD/BcsL family acetyltransferase involved in cellulose biosynthesis